MQKKGRNICIYAKKVVSSARPFPKNKRTILGGSRSFRKRKDAPPLRKYVRVLRDIRKICKKKKTGKPFTEFVVLSTYSPKGTLRMVVRVLRDIHQLYFLAGTACLHFYPQKIRFYASINVLFAHKSNNILLFWLKNINKFVYMQFLLYICSEFDKNGRFYDKT